jgi:large subunit ribosomal protein L15
MLGLHNLKPHKKSIHRRKVVGRGVGSGHGTFSGRGAKGQKARSGGKIPVGFEGGRMPLQRQIPKRRGFTSLAAKAQVVNLRRLEKYFKSNDMVNPKTLFNHGLIGDQNVKVKILSNGEINKALSFEKVLVSKVAAEKITKAGGKIIS